MIIKKSDKIDIDSLIKDDLKLTDKAMGVLENIVELHNTGVEQITNKDIAEATGLSIRQVVGVMNGLTKKVAISRSKEKMMVEKEITVFRFNQEG